MAEKLLFSDLFTNKETMTISLVNGLSSALEEISVRKDTTLGELLKENQMAYTSDIRVNGEIREENYILKSNDIVSNIGRVSGGY